MLAKDGAPGLQAVAKGYVALVPATRGLAGITAIPDLKNRHGNRPCRAQLIHCLLAGRTAIGERVWDTRVLLDWALEHLAGIDSQRVAMLGNSGGGVLTVYAAALDPRIKVAAPSCSFTSYTSPQGFIFHCDCCLVPRAQSEWGDLADIAGLIAPRPFIAIHGTADGLHHRPTVESAISRVSEIYDQQPARLSDRVILEWGDGGHKFYPNLMWPHISQYLDQ